MLFHEGVFLKISPSGPLNLQEANWWNRETQNRAICRSVLLPSIVLHVRRSLSQVTIKKEKVGDLRLRVHRANVQSVKKKIQRVPFSRDKCARVLFMKRIPKIYGESKDTKIF